MSVEPWQLIVLLGAVTVAAALLMPRRGTGSRPDDASAVQLQTALEQFMETMEADNREIAASIAGFERRVREENAGRDERIAALERRTEELERMLSQTERRLAERIEGLGRIDTAGAAEAAAVPERLPDGEGREREEPTIRSRYAELFALHEQGKSVEAIAKQTGMNKGEVMLILQLAKREEEKA
ncbi:MAG: hypothetical protein A9Z00_05130 [Thermobacillus sp. ZCTH02-B1]|uniref:hypothetical protein n=1 Tax=Thermobacillus sp. ZCTH02-B1 TaxID=1858795 RepID=UPI000B56AC33|nr:hypothetical protein [Thermobacillus sp. ZCTH02-B1]OUM96953.1 MAG: hypothetical protein A9Z00_05130 [Thermobacillus sp. ZCTH02-B1]